MLIEVSITNATTLKKTYLSRKSPTSYSLLSFPSALSLSVDLELWFKKAEVMSGFKYH